MGIGKGKADFSGRDDEELVALANAGEAAAMEALYFRYRDWLLRQAYRFCGNRDDALDVMQDVFAYFIGKFPGFELRCRMTTFLYPVVKNLSLAVLNKRRRTVPLDEDVPEPSAPAAPTDEPQQQEGLLEGLKRLPVEQREVIHLRFTEDMSLQEISQALEIPLGTVKSRLHNALEHLRESLA